VSLHFPFFANAPLSALFLPSWGGMERGVAVDRMLMYEIQTRRFPLLIPLHKRQRRIQIPTSNRLMTLHIPTYRRTITRIGLARRREEFNFSYYMREREAGFPSNEW